MKQIAAILILLLATTCWANPVTWLDSKSEAMQLAQNECTLVLLVAGRATCGDTNAMMSRCESNDPDPRKLFPGAGPLFLITGRRLGHGLYVVQFCPTESIARYLDIAPDARCDIHVQVQ